MLTLTGSFAAKSRLCWGTCRSNVASKRSRPSDGGVTLSTFSVSVERQLFPV